MIATTSLVVLGLTIQAGRSLVPIYAYEESDPSYP